MEAVGVRIQGLRKSFGHLEVLRGIDLDIQPGEVVSIIGPSGSGKSTLLRAINRLEEPTAGRIYIGNQEITDRATDIDEVRSKVGMVFQNFNLFPHMTVGQNLTVPLRKVKKVPAQHAERVGPANVSRTSASQTNSIPAPAGCPAGSNSGSRSPVPWRWNPS